VNTPYILPLVGLLYALFFSLLSFLRKEGLSLRFLIEALSITAVFSLLALLARILLHPVAFLLVLYVTTMRVRLLVDLGSLLARRGKLAAAGALYSLASALGPDPAGALLLRLNQAACSLQQGRPEEAIPMLQGLLEKASVHGLGIKYRCACHYNLGLAYWRKQMLAEAARELETILELWPVSEYARRAEAALEKVRSLS